MPVLLTGAEGAVGRLAARHLAAAGGEVRVYLDLEGPTPADPGQFRAIGCKVAQGALDDEGHLETAMEQVHTVLQLACGPLHDPDAHVQAAATMLSAALGAGCRRLVWLSDVAVDDPRGNPWLKALAEIEALLADAPVETVVLRCALIYGPDDPLTTWLAGATPTAGNHWPLWAGDAARAAVAADADRAASTGDLHLVMPVTGPEQVTLPALAAALRTALGPVAGARPAVPAHAAELLARDVARPPAAVGRSGTPLAQALALLAR